MPARPAWKPVEEGIKSKPTINLIPIRKEVTLQTAGAQRETERRLYLTFSKAIESIFSPHLKKNKEMKGTKFSDMISNISRDTFKGASVKYDHNKDTKVYSVKATLNDKPVILTLRIGNEFSEISVTDLKTRIIESLSENKGKFGFERERMASV